ncbi:uncharacterized protein LOC143207886 [Lasioglossum baleicum]|uniref:uncharacterized protein LOC143207886 n=1 Tax=Lasioglossum baleicum TaxID=434251 RepID=UPI003FCDF89A
MCTKREYFSKNSQKLDDTKDAKPSNNDDNKSSQIAHIQVTPQMIRAAVKRLQLRKLYVNLNLITEYLRRSYPVDRNKKTFRDELIKKLDCAVRVGLIVMHGQDAYCLPNIRDEANNIKTAFSAFWEMYRNYKKSPVLRYGNQNKKQSTAKRKLRNMIEYLEK